MTTTITDNSHKTAIARQRLGKAYQKAMQQRWWRTDYTLFDFGCGRGSDVKKLKEMGYTISGFDPYYWPNNPLAAADVVFCNYVLNVIVDPPKRIDILRQIKAMGLICVVAVREDRESVNDTWKKYRDGYLTPKGTFQHFFTEQEFVKLVNTVLGVAPQKIAKGIYTF